MTGKLLFSRNAWWTDYKAVTREKKLIQNKFLNKVKFKKKKEKKRLTNRTRQRISSQEYFSKDRYSKQKQQQLQVNEAQKHRGWTRPSTKLLAQKV